MTSLSMLDSGSSASTTESVATTESVCTAVEVSASTREHLISNAIMDDTDFVTATNLEDLCNKKEEEKIGNENMGIVCVQCPVIEGIKSVGQPLNEQEEQNFNSNSFGEEVKSEFEELRTILSPETDCHSSSTPIDSNEIRHQQKVSSTCYEFGQSDISYVSKLPGEQNSPNTSSHLCHTFSEKSGNQEKSTISSLSTSTPISAFSMTKLPGLEIINFSHCSSFPSSQYLSPFFRDCRQHSATSLLTTLSLIPNSCLTSDTRSSDTQYFSASEEGTDSLDASFTSVSSPKTVQE